MYFPAFDANCTVTLKKFKITEYQIRGSTEYQIRGSNPNTVLQLKQLSLLLATRDTQYMSILFL